MRTRSQSRLIHFLVGVMLGVLAGVLLGSTVQLRKQASLELHLQSHALRVALKRKAYEVLLNNSYAFDKRKVHLPCITGIQYSKLKHFLMQAEFRRKAVNINNQRGELPETAFHNITRQLHLRVKEYRQLRSKLANLNTAILQLPNYIGNSATESVPQIDHNPHSMLMSHDHTTISWSYFNDHQTWYCDEKINPRYLTDIHTYYQYEVQMTLQEVVRAANRITGDNLALTGYTDAYIHHDPLNGNQYIVDGTFSKDVNMFWNLLMNQPVFEGQIHLSQPLSQRYNAINTLPAENSRIVHFVVPISDVNQRLVLFLENYEEEFLAKQERTSLTLTVYKKDTIAFVKEKVWQLLQKYPLHADITIISGRGKFSRGRALHSAMSHMKGGDLVFLCDVDLIVTRDFLYRCRANTKRGKKVYYPEFFKLYNEKYIFRSAAENKTLNSRPDIDRQSGHWAFYSYGMACIYKSDYDAIGGFDQALEGWGGEDVQLVEDVISRGLEVFRAPDIGLMHRWHHKHCSTSDNQYRECLWSKTENLADKLDLARLVFSMEEVINC